MHCCTGFLYLRIFHSLFSSCFFQRCTQLQRKKEGVQRESETVPVR